MSRKEDENSPLEEMNAALDFLDGLLRSVISLNLEDQSAEGPKLSIQQTTNHATSSASLSRISRLDFSSIQIPDSLTYISDHPSKNGTRKIPESLKQETSPLFNIASPSPEKLPLKGSASSNSGIHSWYETPEYRPLVIDFGDEPGQSSQDDFVSSASSHSTSATEQLECLSTLSSCPTDDPQSQENASNIPKPSSLKKSLLSAANDLSQKRMTEQHEKAKATNYISERTVDNSLNRRCGDKQLYETCTIPSCDKVFGEPHDFSVHVVRLFKGGQYACAWPTCERKFLMPTDIVPHLLTHSGETPFGCNFSDCNEKFKDSEELIYHTRNHTDEKPFICGRWRVRFARSELTLPHTGANLQE